METQKTPNSQSGVEKEKQLGKSDSLISDYTTQLQSSRQCGGKNQKYRPMEQGRKPRNKLMHLCVPYF